VEMGALSQKNHKKNAQKWPTRVQYVRRAFWIFENLNG
jgi:hypothetical protein